MTRTHRRSQKRGRGAGRARTPHPSIRCAQAAIPTARPACSSCRAPRDHHRPV